METFLQHRKFLGHAQLHEFRTNCLAHPIPQINAGWEDVLVPFGLLLAGTALRDEDMLDWANQWIQHHFASGFQPGSRVGDDIRGVGHRKKGVCLTQYSGDWGIALVLSEWLRNQKSQKLQEILKQVCDHICKGSLRLDDGAIAHGPGSRYKAVWVDTLYYTAAPLARASFITKDSKHAKEAIRQCLLHAGHLQDVATGCFFHDFDSVNQKRTEAFWARGNGWVIMTLADVLEFCPRSTPDWSDVLRIYQDLANGLLRLQHACGLWRIVPENEESHLETSGSIMMATGLCVGIRNGWLDRSLSQRVVRTWREILTWIDGHGRLLGCQAPAGRGGWELHKLSGMGEHTYGTGSLLRFLAEMRMTSMV